MHETNETLDVAGNKVNAAVNGETAGKKGMNNIDVVFLGDSITEGGNWDTYFPGVLTENKGKSGDKTIEVINRLDRVITLNPKNIFIMIGINDLLQGIEQESIISNYDKIITILKRELPDSTLYIQSVLPVNNSLSSLEIDNTSVDNLNDGIEKLSMKYGLTYISINLMLQEDGQLSAMHTVDGIHLKPAAYLVWSDAIKGYIDTTQK